MIQTNGSRRAAYLLLMLVLPCVSCLAEETKQVTEVSASSSTTSAEKILKKPRLKYRNGPVCMCNDGMSEADIQAAEKKRAKQ